ncbi:MAG: sigma 54-interacting transcriptional regulator, partial [Halobacteria archaeon]
LRVLEDGIVDRLGSKKPIKVDVRFIAASNRDLESLVASEKFRADLFYRLRVITIRVPPLRERKEDIPLLVNYFIKIISERLGKRITGIEPSILEIFKKYDWPGNIRELKNAVEEMITLSQNETLNILPSFLRDIKSESVAFNQETLKLDIIEEETIKKALQRFGGDKVQAAKSLGISLRTLYRKLKKLNRLN